MKQTLFFLGLFLSFLHSTFAQTPPLKLLHLSFHRGCIAEIEAVGKELNFEVESWFIPDLPPQFLDGESEGNALYNISHERAEKIWNKHQYLFDEFDVIFVSDTAPIARVFLQNHWKKPLIIWICNRFDYHDVASLDCDFPDREYYDLFREARNQENVHVVAYTAFEHYYAKKKGVDTGDLIITPCSPQVKTTTRSSIPSTCIKEELFFLPPYHNEKNYIDLSAHLETLGIPNFRGRYNGAADLKDFKGIIHLPYSWSNLALFENLRLGIPYFIPSASFFQKLASQGNYFHPSLSVLLNEGRYDLSEWYNEEHKEIFTYFDSWKDLEQKIKETDFDALHKKIEAFGARYAEKMLNKWRTIFDTIAPQPAQLPPQERSEEPPFVIGRLYGQMGNQFFIIAATYSLALDHGAVPFFPDLAHPSDPSFGLETNYENLFFHLNATLPQREITYYFREKDFTHSPIFYHDNMELRGWFQSEKYFSHHKKEIVDLFAPSPAIRNYLEKKYATIINHPHTVSLHVRSYLKEDPEQRVYPTYGVDYYKKAMALFPEETLFVVFSPQIEWCKEHLAPLAKNICFIENENYYHDFYLMSLCKDNIICNSTFSWWAAYLNPNPHKQVIVPPLWFSPSYDTDTKDLIPPEWKVLESLSL